MKLLTLYTQLLLLNKYIGFILYVLILFIKHIANKLVFIHRPDGNVPLCGIIEPF